MKKGIITVKTITVGQKGKKALSRSGIKSILVKIDSSKTTSGCQYGLEVNERDFYSAISTLRENGIEYGVYKEK